MTLARLDALLDRDGRTTASSSSATFSTRARDELRRRCARSRNGARRHASVSMTLVRGNHDVRAGDPPDCMKIECVDGPLIDGPFALAHHPSVVPGAYVLCGHVHPGARLYGAGRERVRVPCFWFGRDYAVLPAFGEFTGLADIEVSSGDRVWVTTGEEVIPVITRID